MEDSDFNFIDEIGDEKLPFAKTEVVRLMKMNLSDDAKVREKVKVEMNRFLYIILRDICRELDSYDTEIIDYEMFKDCVYPYLNIHRINQEKERIILHLESIKSDCDSLELDVKRTLRSKRSTDMSGRFNYD